MAQDNTTDSIFNYPNAKSPENRNTQMQLNQANQVCYLHRYDTNDNY